MYYTMLSLISVEFNKKGRDMAEEKTDYIHPAVWLLDDDDEDLPIWAIEYFLSTLDD